MLEFLQDYLETRLAEGLVEEAKIVQDLIDQLLDGATDEELWATLDASTYEQMHASFEMYME